jgi:hypothetical protein
MTIRRGRESWILAIPSIPIRTLRRINIFTIAIIDDGNELMGFTFDL